MRTRTPFPTGLSGGLVGCGRVSSPLTRRRSACGAAPRRLIPPFDLEVATWPVHGSQASPRPSLSVSACAGSATDGQSSIASQTPSPSPSMIVTSAGQLADEPVQYSTGSQVFAAERHTVLDGARASAGQVFEVPSQLSARSQTPADERHTAVLFASAGQLTLVPVHFSARS